MLCKKARMSAVVYYPLRADDLVDKELRAGDLEGELALGAQPHHAELGVAVRHGLGATQSRSR